jgi:hypothetical protein
MISPTMIASDHATVPLLRDSHAKCTRKKKRGRFGRDDRRGRLVGVGEVVELGFEGLVVLALDLELGLEFLDQEFEARDFGAEFQGVGGDLTLTWRLRLSGVVKRSGVVGWRGKR